MVTVKYSNGVNKGALNFGDSYQAIEWVQKAHAAPGDFWVDAICGDSRDVRLYMLQAFVILYKGTEDARSQAQTAYVKWLSNTDRNAKTLTVS